MGVQRSFSGTLKYHSNVSMAISTNIRNNATTDSAHVGLCTVLSQTSEYAINSRGVGTNEIAVACMVVSVSIGLVSCVSREYKNKETCRSYNSSRYLVAGLG